MRSFRSPLPWLALALTAGLLAAHCRTTSSKKGVSGKTPDPKLKVKAGTAKMKDITAKARRWNSTEYVRPPTKFRKVTVRPRKLPAKAVSGTGRGFSVQLPRRATLTTPAVYRGAIYVSGGFRSKEFYALDAATGRLKWAIHLGDDGPSAPACEDGVCVFNTESCTVFAVDAETGRLLWSWWLGDPQMSAPAVAGGLAFTSYPARRHRSFHQAAPNAVHPNAVPQVAPMAAKMKKWPTGGSNKLPPGQTHALAAFDLKTGKLVWQRWIDGDVMSAPVAVGSHLWAATFTGTLYKFHQKTGRILSAKLARATSAPVVVNGEVLLTQRADGKGAKRVIEAINRQSARLAANQDSRFYNSVRAPYLDRKVQLRSHYAKQGKADDTANGFGGGAPQTANADKAADNIGQISVSTLQAFQGARILNWDNRNVNVMGDRIIATSHATGKRLWTVKLKGSVKKAGGFLAAPPAAAGGYLFVATLAGEVLQIRPTTDKVVRRYKVGAAVRSQPIVHQGWIYVGTQIGKLVAIFTGDRTLTGWTQWGGNAARTSTR